MQNKIFSRQYDEMSNGRVVEISKFSPTDAITIISLLRSGWYIMFIFGCFQMNVFIIFTTSKKSTVGKKWFFLRKIKFIFYAFDILDENLFRYLTSYKNFNESTCNSIR